MIMSLLNSFSLENLLAQLAAIQQVADVTPGVPPEKQKIYDRNKEYLKPGAHTYNTKLNNDQEQQFLEWVKSNNVPFDPASAITDYDMRGFWKALEAGDERAKSAIDPNDNKIHYPDYWKTPYHETFSNESQWATPAAPRWNDKDQLVTTGGKILFDDRAGKEK